MRSEKSESGIIRCGHVRTAFGNVHYREAGCGEAVMLLHINRQSSETYLELIEALASNCHAIALDYPGYGLSDHPAGQLRVEDYAACARDVLFALGQSSAILFGEALGAAVALAFAAEYPDCATALVLVNTPLMADHNDALARIGAARRLATTDSAEQDDADFVANHGQYAPLKPSKSWIERVRRAHRQCGADCWRGADALVAFNLRGALDAVRCPVLLLTGEFSPFADFRKDIEACLPAAVSETVPDARFGIGWEKAQHIAARAVAFRREIAQALPHNRI